MTTTERKTAEKRAANLLTAVSINHSPEVTDSVVNRFGNLHSISCRELEEMIDDLISKMNDRE